MLKYIETSKYKDNNLRFSVDYYHVTEAQHLLFYRAFVFFLNNYKSGQYSTKQLIVA